MISAVNLSKAFRRPVEDPGMKGALKHLVRPEFRDVTAVDDISFSVEEGESVAYAGPNGAEKSTTFTLLTGILVPTSGEVTVCGLHPFEQRQANARNIGVVFGQRTQLWWAGERSRCARAAGAFGRVAGGDVVLRQLGVAGGVQPRRDPGRVR